MTRFEIIVTGNGVNQIIDIKQDIESAKGLTKLLTESGIDERRIKIEIKEENNNLSIKQ